MKIKTAELTGIALDWALAKAMNADKVWIDHGYVDVNARFHLHVYEPFNHTDPATCLGLIKQYRASIDHTEHAPQIEVSIWYALTDEADPDFDCQSVIGDTVEQAVARCVVQMRLGDEVSVPDELAGDAAREVVK